MHEKPGEPGLGGFDARVQHRGSSCKAIAEYATRIQKPARETRELTRIFLNLAGALIFFSVIRVIRG
jgi:hypothetical protein